MMTMGMGTGVGMRMACAETEHRHGANTKFGTNSCLKVGAGSPHGPNAGILDVARTEDGDEYQYRLNIGLGIGLGFWLGIWLGMELGFGLGIRLRIRLDMRLGMGLSMGLSMGPGINNFSKIPNFSDKFINWPSPKLG